MYIGAKNDDKEVSGKPLPYSLHNKGKYQRNRYRIPNSPLPLGMGTKLVSL